MGSGPQNEARPLIDLGRRSTRSADSPAAVLVLGLALLFGALYALAVWASPASAEHPARCDYDVGNVSAHQPESAIGPLGEWVDAEAGPTLGQQHEYDASAQTARASASRVAGFLAPQTGGGGVISVDLYAVGREGGPPFPRSSDLELDGDDVCPSAVDEDGFFRGLSTFASPQDLAANVSGQVWRLPAGTSLRDLAVVADGQDYNPRSPFPSSHHTIYPTRRMGYAELRERYQGLGWVHIGHTRDFQ